MTSMCAHALKPFIFFIQNFNVFDLSEHPKNQVLQEDNTIFLIHPGELANHEVGSVT